MQPDWDFFVRMLVASVTAGVVLAVAAYWILRWVVYRITQRVAVFAEGRVAATLAPGVSRTQARLSKPVVIGDDIRARRLAELDRLAWLMDGIIPLPVVGGIGLDALLGLFPVAGDVASLAISSIVVVRAAQLGAPSELIGRLMAIQIIDLLLGLVPIVGDIADAGYHSNERSVALLREWLERERRQA